MASDLTRPPRDGKRMRNVDGRRELHMAFKRFYKYSGHGVYREIVDGAPQGEREIVTFHLRRNFGATFNEGAFFYKNPDRKKFLAYIMHAASRGRVPKDADIDLSKLFEERKKKCYHVNAEYMQRLGCTKDDLRDLFSTLPSTHHTSRAKNARPLILDEDGPREVMPREAVDTAETAETAETTETAAVDSPTDPAPEQSARPTKRRKIFESKRDLSDSLEKKNIEIFALRASLDKLKTFILESGLKPPIV